jgi:hypothetical protein
LLSPSGIDGIVTTSKAGRPHFLEELKEPGYFHAKGRQYDDDKARPDVSCIAKAGNGSSA